jgi:hypothetical protein
MGIAAGPVSNHDLPSGIPVIPGKTEKKLQ